MTARSGLHSARTVPETGNASGARASAAAMISAVGSGGSAVVRLFPGISVVPRVLAEPGPVPIQALLDVVAGPETGAPAAQ